MTRKNKKLSADMSVGCLIGANSVIEGNFVTSESARIDGEIRGNVDAKGKLYIGTKGKVVGNIQTEAIMVSGQVDGDIVCSGRVEITSSGIVNGDIQAKILTIDENAAFNGRCGMIVENDKNASATIVKANVKEVKENAS